MIGGGYGGMERWEMGIEMEMETGFARPWFCFAVDLTTVIDMCNLRQKNVDARRWQLETDGQYITKRLCNLLVQQKSEEAGEWREDLKKSGTTMLPQKNVYTRWQCYGKGFRLKRIRERGFYHRCKFKMYNLQRGTWNGTSRLPWVWFFVLRVDAMLSMAGNLEILLLSKMSSYNI